MLLWVGAAGSLEAALSQTWARLRSDWFMLIVITDHLVIAGVVLLWVWGDMGRRGFSSRARLAWLGTLVALGTPTLLAYIAERPPASGSRPTAAA